MSSIIDRQKLIKENLSKWEDLSPLSEAQVKSILLLAQLNQFQLDVAEDDDGGDDLASTQNTETNLDQQQKSSDLAKKSTPTTTNNLLHEDINELLYNFDINDIEDPKIEKYVLNLQRNSRKCGQISDSIEAAFGHLSLLLDNYSQVSQKTKSLHVACEQLLNDQVIYSPPNTR